MESGSMYKCFDCDIGSCVIVMSGIAIVKTICINCGVVRFQSRYELVSVTPAEKIKVSLLE